MPRLEAKAGSVQLLEPTDKLMEWFNPSRYGFPKQTLKNCLVQKTALVSCEHLSFKLGNT